MIPDIYLIGRNYFIFSRMVPKNLAVWKKEATEECDSIQAAI